MKAAARRSLFDRAAPLLALVVASACRSSVATMPGCTHDTQCPSNQACLAAVCISRDAPAGMWSVELVPPSDSNAASTEINGVMFDGGPVTWTARAKVTVTGTLGAGSTLTGSSHVIATVPAMIPGRADLEFEGEWPAVMGNEMPAPFMLSVPDSVLGRDANLSVLPTPPDDRKQAPVTVTTKVAAMMWLSFPSDALTVRGRLLSAIQIPQSGFLARVFQGDQLISNVAETQKGDGMFSLVIPTINVSAGSNGDVTIELAPSDDQSPFPRFTSHAIKLAGNTDLGDLHLPTSGDPNAFRFDVRGDSVSGAVVRAHTSISGSADGSADYTRSSVTDAQGIADLSLVPGNVDTLRAYDITVVPPPDSPFGVACIPAFPLAAGGTVQAPALAKKVALPRRAVVSGALVDASGAPVASMTIGATRLDANPSGSPCAAAIAGPASVTSDKNGLYTLLLDPGTYRLDYDPPAGAAVPRLTEAALGVTGDTRHDVALPTATLVQGSLMGPQGEPLPSVVIHLFRIACGGAAQPCTGPNRVEPWLRATARSDAKGAFRMVVPQGAGL